MSICGADGQSGQFALVCYIPQPLAGFLDRLRLELTPDSKPRAHVTVLPPRPAILTAAEAEQDLLHESREIHPFRVEAGSVEVFPDTNVIYISIARGERELRSAHCDLNSGRMAFECAFPYHPHITIAQGIPAEQLEEKLALARDRWAAWTGPRGFDALSLSFVHSTEPHVWHDLATIELDAVPAHR